MTVRLLDLPLPALLALRDGDIDTAAAQLGLEIPADFAAHVDMWTFMSGLRSIPANEGWTITSAGFSPAGDRIHERWGRQLVFRRNLSRTLTP